MCVIIVSDFGSEILRFQWVTSSSYTFCSLFYGTCIIADNIAQIFVYYLCKVIDSDL
jgi:hypothetical protein